MRLSPPWRAGSPPPWQRGLQAVAGCSSRRSPSRERGEERKNISLPSLSPRRRLATRRLPLERTRSLPPRRRALRAVAPCSSRHRASRRGRRDRKKSQEEKSRCKPCIPDLSHGQLSLTGAWPRHTLVRPRPAPPVSHASPPGLREGPKSGGGAPAKLQRPSRRQKDGGERRVPSLAGGRPRTSNRRPPTPALPPPSPCHPPAPSSASVERPEHPAPPPDQGKERKKRRDLPTKKPWRRTSKKRTPAVAASRTGPETPPALPPGPA